MYIKRHLRSNGVYEVVLRGRVGWCDNMWTKVLYCVIQMIELGLLSVTNGFGRVDLVGVDPRCQGVGDEIKGNFDKKKIFSFFCSSPQANSPLWSRGCISRSTSYDNPNTYSCRESCIVKHIWGQRGHRRWSWEVELGGVVTDEFFHSKNVTFENNSNSSCFNDRIGTSKCHQWIRKGRFGGGRPPMSGGGRWKIWNFLKKKINLFFCSSPPANVPLWSRGCISRSRSYDNPNTYLCRELCILKGFWGQRGHRRRSWEVELGGVTMGEKKCCIMLYKWSNWDF